MPWCTKKLGYPLGYPSFLIQVGLERFNPTCRWQVGQFRLDGIASLRFAFGKSATSPISRTPKFSPCHQTILFLRNRSFCFFLTSPSKSATLTVESLSGLRMLSPCVFKALAEPDGLFFFYFKQVFPNYLLTSAFALVTLATELLGTPVWTQHCEPWDDDGSIKPRLNQPGLFSSRDKTRLTIPGIPVTMIPKAELMVVAREPFSATPPTGVGSASTSNPENIFSFGTKISLTISKTLL